MIKYKKMITITEEDAELISEIIFPNQYNDEKVDVEEILSNETFHDINHIILTIIERDAVRHEQGWGKKSINILTATKAVKDILTPQQ